MVAKLNFLSEMMEKLSVEIDVKFMMKRRWEVADEGQAHILIKIVH